MRPEDLLARLEAGYEYGPMYGQICNERDQLKAENAKLRELLSESFLLMHNGGLTTGAYGRCMELFMDAQTLGIEIPFMHDMEMEADK